MYLKRRKTMNNRTDNTLRQQDDFNASETTNQRALDRIADEVAHGAARTEQRYDQDHDIFTK
jgi:uncharacterized protein YukE